MLSVTAGGNGAVIIKKMTPKCQSNKRNFFLLLSFGSFIFQRVHLGAAGTMDEINPSQQ